MQQIYAKEGKESKVPNKCNWNHIKIVTKFHSIRSHHDAHHDNDFIFISIETFR